MCIRDSGYSELAAEQKLLTGGYKIYATINPEVQAIVDKVYELSLIHICKTADVLTPEQGGGAARGELQHVVAARRSGRGMQAMEQIADADLLEQIGAVL